MNNEPKTIEEYHDLLEKLREEAGQRNEPLGRSDTKSLQAIRKLLHLPRYGFPIQRWESDADGNLYLD